MLWVPVTNAVVVGNAVLDRVGAGYIHIEDAHAQDCAYASLALPQGKLTVVKMSGRRRGFPSNNTHPYHILACR